MTVAYPLQWPEGWPRTQSHERMNNFSFKVTFGTALQHLQWDLQRMRATGIVISSNLTVNRSGQPREDQSNSRISDPGVAIYYTRRDRQMVMARDKFLTVRENLRSIGLAIEALRAIERHGGSTMMERAFEGFAQLPPPGSAPKMRLWWEVFDFQQDPSDMGAIAGKALIAGIEVMYRDKAKKAHPDSGGSDIAMAELNAAIAKAREVLGA